MMKLLTQKMVGLALAALLVLGGLIYLISTLPWTDELGLITAG